MFHYTSVAKRNTRNSERYQ